MAEFESHSQRWEVIKLLVRTESIRHSIVKNKKRIVKLEQIEAQLKDLNLPTAQPLTEAQLRLKYSLIAEREDILKYKVEGAILWSKVDWAQAGNKPTKYFLSLEKTQYSRRTITHLKNNQGQTLDSTEELLRHMHEYYSDLYCSRDDQFSEQEMPEFFEGFEVTKLTQSQKETLDEKVSQMEMNEALVDMKDNKTPGPDGLPVEFYKAFWDELKSPFEAMVHEVLHQGFPIDMLRSIFTLSFVA